MVPFEKNGRFFYPTVHRLTSRRLSDLSTIAAISCHSLSSSRRLVRGGRNSFLLLSDKFAQFGRCSSKLERPCIELRQMTTPERPVLKCVLSYYRLLPCSLRYRFFMLLFSQRAKGYERVSRAEKHLGSLRIRYIGSLLARQVVQLAVSDGAIVWFYVLIRVCLTRAPTVSYSI